jgi:hypothetical protein
MSTLGQFVKCGGQHRQNEGNNGRKFEENETSVETTLFVGLCETTMQHGKLCLDG